MTTGNNVWYYFKDGKAVTGRQNIDGKEYYFDNLGRQVKGSSINTPKGVEYYESVLGERGLLSKTVRLSSLMTMVMLILINKGCV